jgi:hypothetical protein
VRGRRVPAKSTRRPRMRLRCRGSGVDVVAGGTSMVACCGSSRPRRRGARWPRGRSLVRRPERPKPTGRPLPRRRRGAEEEARTRLGRRAASRREPSWLCAARFERGRVDLERAAGSAGGEPCVGGPRKDAPLPAGRCRCKACPTLDEEDPRSCCSGPGVFSHAVSGTGAADAPAVSVRGPLSAVVAIEFQRTGPVIELVAVQVVGGAAAAGHPHPAAGVALRP